MPLVRHHAGATTRRPSRGAAALLLAGLGLLCAAARVGAREGQRWELEPPAPRVLLKPAVLEGAAANACVDCHRVVGEEWSRSAHALAWVDEEYQAELAERERPELCHGCHIPQRLLADGLGKRPKARSDEPHFGISCESCHLDAAGNVLGPRGAQTSAHTSLASEYMQGRSSELCIACHATNIGPVLGIAKDFRDAGLAESGASCVGCHMAALERPWSNERGDPEAAGPVHEGRSHSLQTPRDPSFLRRAFECSLRVEGGKTIVRIENRAGHRVPGLRGRSLRFRAELFDASGRPMTEGTLELSVRSYLPLAGSEEIVLEGTGASVHLTAEHLDPRAPEPVDFLDERLAR